MNIQIQAYISSLADAIQCDLNILHHRILQLMPDCKQWYLDGTNDEGKQVANPNIGYGVQTIKYKDGSSREFYLIGISANTTGISVYLIGIEDKKFLLQTYGDKIGKAKVTSYCINFKKLTDINIDVLEEAIKYRIGLDK